MTVITTAVTAMGLWVLSDQNSPQAQGTDAAIANQTQATVRPALTPGDILPPDDVSLVEKPGRYGLGADLPGSRYAIARGHLVRIDPDTLKVKSVLREQAREHD